MANFKSIAEYNEHLAKQGGNKPKAPQKTIDVKPVEPTPQEPTVASIPVGELTLEECKTKEDCRSFADANGQKDLKFGNRSVDTIKALIAEAIKG